MDLRLTIEYRWSRTIADTDASAPYLELSISGALITPGPIHACLVPTATLCPISAHRIANDIQYADPERTGVWSARIALDTNDKSPFQIVQFSM